MRRKARPIGWRGGRDSGGRGIAGDASPRFALLPLGEGWGEGVCYCERFPIIESPLTLTLSRRERGPERASHTTCTFRPARRLRLIIWRPLAVRMRARKPILRARFFLLILCG